MKLYHVTSSKIVGVALLAGLWAMACSSDSGDDGTSTTGGTAAVSGGASAKTGGTSAKTGGTSAKTGGASSAGGAATTATGGTSAVATATTAAGGTTVTSTTSAAGGTTGVGGTVAGGGVGGIISSGGDTGTGGAGDVDAGPMTDAGVDCDGCVKLFVPLAVENTGTDFELDFGASTPLDMTVTVVTFRLRVETNGNAGGLHLYAKNDSITNYSSSYGDWLDLVDYESWQEVKLDLAAVSPVAADAGNVFDKSIVRWVGINISSGGTYDGAVFGDTTVYVDWIKFSDGVHPDLMFDGNDPEGFAGNRYNFLAGSAVNDVAILAP